MKGIEYLKSNKLVESNPGAVAQFLRNTPSLNKVEYLFSVYLFIYLYLFSIAIIIIIIHFDLDLCNCL